MESPVKPQKLENRPLKLGALKYLLSGVLFKSGVFAIFSPLPLVWYRLQSKDFLSYLIVLFSNTFTLVFLEALVLFFPSGPKSNDLIWSSLTISAVSYLTIVAPVSLGMARFIRAKLPLSHVLIKTFLLVLVSVVLIWVSVAAMRGQSPIEFYTSTLDHFSTQVWEIAKNSGEPKITEEELRSSLLLETPSSIAIFIIVSIWANLILLFRINPNQVKEKLGIGDDFYKTFRMPELLVWPTIGAGAGVLLLHGIGYGVSINLLKVLLAGYAIHGIGILAALLDQWKLFGIIRLLLFVTLVLFALPLVIGVGFFDLWFDFRNKFRQT